MKIILLRHGKPDIPHHSLLKASELHNWIKAYNKAGIIQTELPPQTTIEQVQGCNFVVCSDLNRSIESARALGTATLSLVDSVFREIELAVVSWSPLTLPPVVWATIFRICQLFGFSRNGESLKMARLRADDASRQLAVLASQHNTVVLVGHGYMNRFIAKRLLASGWTGPKTPGYDYWESSTYCLNEV